MEHFITTIKPTFSVFTDKNTLKVLYLLSIYDNYADCYNICFSERLNSDQISRIESFRNYKTLKEEVSSSYTPSHDSYVAVDWIYAFKHIIPPWISTHEKKPLYPMDQYGENFFDFCNKCYSTSIEKLSLHRHKTLNLIKGVSSALTNNTKSKEEKEDFYSGINVDELSKEIEGTTEIRENKKIYFNFERRARDLGLSEFGLWTLIYFVIHFKDIIYIDMMYWINGREIILTDEQNKLIEIWREKNITSNKMDINVMCQLMLYYK
jgi:hypothetical protein